MNAITSENLLQETENLKEKWSDTLLYVYAADGEAKAGVKVHSQETAFALIGEMEDILKDLRGILVKNL